VAAGAPAAAEPPAAGDEPARAHAGSLVLGIDGAGKTLAAEALARAARTDVSHVDLSRVVSTFIGETEKNTAD
jgi:SpoVK/Ycf46/Vps4 family AAA+-type ATPase